MFLSGKQGSIAVDGSDFNLSKWKAAMNTKVLPVNNFGSEGWQEVLDGFSKATVTAEGFYDSGSMPIEVGQFYEFTLRCSPSIALTVTAMVQDLVVDTDAEGTVNVSITAESDGAFTAAIS